jgi:ubiquitin-protein ligase
MSTVRLRRLQSDFDRLAGLIARHPRLQLLRVDGSPPEKYQVEYHVNSMRQKDGELLMVNSHVVEIFLPRDYPRTPPLCRMLTPVFHPNIAPHAICIGDHWSAGESLAALVTRIGEMLAYQSYNTKSPLNGEAAKWTDQNIERLPLDRVNMHLEEDGPATKPKPASPPAAPIAAPPRPPSRAPSMPPTLPTTPPPAAASIVTCPGCSVKIRVRLEMGTQVRCPRCKTVIPVPA